MESLVKTQSERIANARQEILQLLKWDETEHGLFMLESGLTYLHEYFSGDEQVIGFVKGRKEFWSWWKTQWFYRDLAFIEGIDSSDCTLSFRLHIYRGLHNSKILAAEIFPGREVLGKNFLTTQMVMKCQ